MPTTPESYLDADDPKPVIGLDAGGNKIDPMGRAIDNFFRGLIPGSLPQAPEQVQIGPTGAATPALGIQAGPEPEEQAVMAGDIPSEQMIIGDVPSLDDGGEDATRFETPPQKPEAPEEQGFWMDVIEDFLRSGLGIGEGGQASQRAREQGTGPASIFPDIPGLPLALAGGQVAGGRLLKALSDISRHGVIGPRGRVRSVPLGLAGDKARQLGASAAGSTVPVGRALSGEPSEREPQVGPARSQVANKRLTGSAR